MQKIIPMVAVLITLVAIPNLASANDEAKAIVKRARGAVGKVAAKNHRNAVASVKRAVKGIREAKKAGDSEKVREIAAAAREQLTSRAKAAQGKVKEICDNAKAALDDIEAPEGYYKLLKRSCTGASKKIAGTTKRALGLIKKAASGGGGGGGEE